MGHAFGILMAHVGTLQSLRSFRRPLPWALGQSLIHVKFNMIPQLTVVAALALNLLLSSNAYAQNESSKASREKIVAAERYFKAVPFAEFRMSVMDEMAKQVPPEQQADFLNFMNKEINWQIIEAAARASITKHLTAKELNAMAEFMEKPEGKSVMAKMKYYMADLMPIMQGEVQRAIAKRQGSASEKAR